MSAVNVAVADSGRVGFIITDTIAYTRKKTVVGEVVKAYPIAHANTVFAARGPVNFIADAFHLFERCAGFDEMATALSERIPNLWRIKLVRNIGKALRMSGLAVKQEYDGQIRGILPTNFYLTGYSSRQKRIVACAGSSESAIPFEPLWLPDGQAILGPMLPQEEIGKLAFPRDGEPDKWPAFLLDAMNLQRERSARLGAEKIGGAAVLTTITQSDIQQRVIHRWSDCCESPLIGSSLQRAPSASRSAA